VNIGQGSALDELKECMPEREFGYNLAVSCNHAIVLVKPSTGTMRIVAGAMDEYGYRDATKGSEARFSCPKGIICVRNSVFVTDFWNNVLRCVSLKNGQVETVTEFEPNAPVAMTVSNSGNLYCLDSDSIYQCNILRICSSLTPPDENKDGKNQLGTLTFQNLQKQLSDGRRRSAESDFAGDHRNSGSGAYDDGSVPRRISGTYGDTDAYMSPGATPQGQGAQPGASVDMHRGSISDLRPRGSWSGEMDRVNSYGGLPPDARGSLHEIQRKSMSRAAPRIPRALKTLVPGASLHPALFKMTQPTDPSNPLASRHQSTGDGRSSQAGSQFRVSVASVTSEMMESPVFSSNLERKPESPWSTIPISSLQYIFQESSGNCYPNTPLALAYWEFADLEATDDEESMLSIVPWRKLDVLLVGLVEWPWLLKVTPPQKPPAAPDGRFKAVAVDIHRLLMADCDSNQIFIVNHTKVHKEKIAGCGKRGFLDGPLDVCRMNGPSSLAVDPMTHYIYVADRGNHRIRRCDMSTGFMSTVCGNGCKGCVDSHLIAEQMLDSPYKVQFALPHHLLICCADNSIRKFDLRTNMLETVLIGC